MKRGASSWDKQAFFRHLNNGANHGESCERMNFSWNNLNFGVAWMYLNKRKCMYYVAWQWERCDLVKLDLAPFQRYN